MTRPFADHFSTAAAAYARFRPEYPPALFAWLAGRTARHDLAWDCGTGSGQAARGLAAHFARVVATDASAAQLAQAPPHARVTYRVASASASGLAAGSADLVTAAQAFHWFAAGEFWAEARRVLAPGGVVAIWCYGVCTVSPAIDAVVGHFHQVVVGPDWPPGRALVDAGYRTVVLPFPEITAPPLTIARTLDLPAFGRYVATWSAVQRHWARTGRDPLPALLDALAAPWGDPATPRPVRWPLSLRAGRSGGA